MTNTIEQIRKSRIIIKRTNKRSMQISKQYAKGFNQSIKYICKLLENQRCFCNGDKDFTAICKDHIQPMELDVWNDNLIIIRGRMLDCHWEGNDLIIYSQEKHEESR